jgi:glucose dehydrogenase
MGYPVSHEHVMASNYDVIIVGSGFAGANMAHILGAEPFNKKVLVIEAGPGLEHSREDYLENFFLNTFKSPSSPYPPNDNGLDPSRTNAPRATTQGLVLGWNNPQMSYLTYPENPTAKPFASTYERLAGGTGNHWMGTCLRMAPDDLATNSLYGVGRDWPLNYGDLTDFYNIAEKRIGVSASVEQQIEAVGDQWDNSGFTEFTDGYNYPMAAIPPSVGDQAWAQLTGLYLTGDNPTGAVVSPTPAGRNSQPYMNRRVCHGNTNCTPMCPIQAKYDPQFTLGLALDTGNVDMISKSVVDWIDVDENGLVSELHYITYDDISVPAQTGATGFYSLSGLNDSAGPTIVVLAAHAIENARLLLNSARVTQKNIANSSDMVGRNLMDHPTYLAWGLMPEGSPVYGYRGPLSTSGIENLRTSGSGGFRSNRAPWRIEIGNEGWNWPTGDPYASGLDFVYGSNNGQLNGQNQIFGNMRYQSKLNNLLVRQFRMAFLVEQPAIDSNRVLLSGTYADNLGIPRPEVHYDLDQYTLAGFASAAEATETIMTGLGAKNYTQVDPDAGTTVHYQGVAYNYSGAGHLCGTHIMGSNAGNSVVDPLQKSHDHDNLYIVGCGSMPSIGTENPTLTMLALACRTAISIGA